MHTPYYQLPDVLSQTAGVLPHDKPFDAIHVGAAADTVPQALLARLAEGGRMVIPVGPQHGEQASCFKACF